MKSLNLLTVLSVVFLFVSCGKGEDHVTFITPQPLGSDDLKTFPRKFEGTYRSLTDSSLLVISKHQLISQTTGSFKNTIDQLDSADRAQVITWGDTILTIPEEPGSYYIIFGDSIELHINGVDSLFDIQKGDVLRKFKGYFFANIRHSDDSWNTMKITPTRQGLIVSRISYADEIDGLKELTVVKDDSVIHSYNPSRKQMKLFIRQEGFKTEEHYVRID
jgi:hypothetical protein